jgi:hypothetical protein
MKVLRAAYHEEEAYDGEVTSPTRPNVRTTVRPAVSATALAVTSQSTGSWILLSTMVLTKA